MHVACFPIKYCSTVNPFMIFLCFNCSSVFLFSSFDQKMHYGTTVLYCVVYFHVFNFHFSPYPRKLNDNEKLWIYAI